MDKSIKIACIGNMNNMMFTTCRYLRDLGYDASLFLIKNEAFLPEDDSYEDEYKNYTFTLDIDRATIDKDCTEISNQLKEYSFLIGNDIAPAIMTRIGRVLDIFVPHGSDMYAFPFETKKEKGVDGIWWLNSIKLMAKLQRKNLEKIPVVLFPDEYEIHFPYKNKLKMVAQFYNFSVPMLFHRQYRIPLNSSVFKKLDYFEFFNKIREENEFIIFSHSRQNGEIKDENLKIHEKGNLLLIEGFASFVKSCNIKTALILFEYGLNIEASKQLIEELEIGSHVIWAPKMKRKEIMFGLKQADVGCGQFVNSWLTCGVVNETLAAQTPLLHYRKDELYLEEYPELYPVLNANSVQEIEAQLNYALKNKEELKKLGTVGSDWIEKYSVQKAISTITETIESRLEKVEFTELEKKKIDKLISNHKLRLKVMSMKQRLIKS